MFVKSYCSSISGIEAVTVAVEVNITAGIGMYLVGLPDNAVRESQERIRAAFENCEYKMSGKKVVVNLSPADLRKEGSAYDLPIAVAMLAASGQIDAAPLSRYVLLGELSLDGSILPVKGALPIAMQALKEGFAGIILPEENAREAAVVKGLDVYGIGNLREVVNFLQGFTNLTPARINLDETFTEAQRSFDGDFCDVKGQAQVKRALEVAAAGGHNVLMIGPPGSGKTMLARRMPSIMPPLTLQEALETTRIHSVAGKMGYRQGLLTVRPFRTPHHLTSQVALVGGGANQPGEISLAHNGILFLDELPEFSRNALESLRQPMEEKQIVVSPRKVYGPVPGQSHADRVDEPVPVRLLNHPTGVRLLAGKCREVPEPYFKIDADRIDLVYRSDLVPFADLTHNRPEEDSNHIRKNVVAARKIQQQAMFRRDAGPPNAMMGSSQLREFARSTPNRLAPARNGRWSAEPSRPGRTTGLSKWRARSPTRPKRSHPFQTHRRSYWLPQLDWASWGASTSTAMPPGQNRPLSFVRIIAKLPAVGIILSSRVTAPLWLVIAITAGVYGGMAVAGNGCGLVVCNGRGFRQMECWIGN